MRISVKKDLSGAQGFTLIEVCIVTIISGLIFVSMYDLYARYAKQQDKTLTITNLQTVASEVGNYYNVQNRYPCPADRTLKYNDPNFGKEIDPTADITGSCDVTVAVGLTPGKCFSAGAGLTPAGTNGVGGVCMFDCSALNATATGCGDKTGVDTYTDGAGTHYKNVVLIGAVPIATIRADAGIDAVNNTNIIYDAWGGQIDYVVSYSLTRTSIPTGGEGTYKYDRGAITIHDENGNNTAGSINNAHYGFVSHGPDRIGGYTRDGQLTGICGSHVPQSYATGDDQNCSNNATFLQGIRDDSKTALHNDDLTYFVVITSGGLWQQLTPGPDMQNINVGAVNVGTSAAPAAPNVAMDVGDPTGGANGIIHADNSTNAGAAGVKAASICDKDTATGCFPVQNIVAAAPIITCPAGKIMQGIGNSLADCVAPTFSGLLPNQSCSIVGDHWIVGVTSDGHIICQ